MVRLEGFMGFLHNNGLLNADVIQYDTHEGFVNRLRLQKLVYLGQEVYGLSFDDDDVAGFTYGFSSYKYGPYSSDLASDYYNIDPEDIYDGEEELEIDFQDYVNSFQDKDEQWLEIAATLYDNVGSLSNDKLISLVNNMKPRYPIEHIRQVFDDLVSSGIITASP